ECLGDGEVRLETPYGITKLVRDFELEVLQQGPLTGEQQLGVAYRVHLPAEAQGHGKLQAKFPFLVVARRQVLEGTRPFSEQRSAVVADQVVTRTEPAVASHRVETGEEVVASGDEFEFATLDHPLLATDLHPPGER